MKTIGRVALSSAALLGLAVGGAWAQDSTLGLAAFAQCSACHSIDGTNGAGPSLKGINGRAAGSFPGFRYSRTMKNAGYVWDATSLEVYITDPQKAVPGNLMPFSGVADAKQRADLIAYLLSLR